jgi:hypothetical protein
MYWPSLAREKSFAAILIQDIVPLKALIILSKMIEANPFVNHLDVPLLLRLNQHKLGTRFASLIVISRVDP